jgi:competence protein ComEA
MRNIFILLFAALITMSIPLSTVAADNKSQAIKPDEASKIVPTYKQPENIKPASAGKNEAAKPPTAPQLIDINTANPAVLMGLFEIGSPYAKMISWGRPYTKKEELVTRQIIPQSTYDKIKDKICVK